MINMGQTTITNIKAAKTELQLAINTLVFEFEQKHGVSLEIDTVIQTSGFDSKIGRKPRKSFSVSLNLDDKYEIPNNTNEAINSLML
jgi:hypothetical protein